MTADLNYADLQRFASQLALDAGSYLRDQAIARMARNQPPGAAYDLGTSIKENAADIVTKADMHAEAMITGAIRERFPEHKIIGEESYSAGQEKRFLLDDDPTWIIDPLDGTVNFVHLYPNCCVSVGFCVNKKPVVGAIFAPLIGGLHPSGGFGTLYSGATGLGSWSTPISFPITAATLSPLSPQTAPRDIPLHPNQPFLHSTPLPYLPPTPIPKDAPKSCLFTAEWGKSRSDAPGSNLTKKVNTLWNFAGEIGGREGKGGMVHGVRSIGSAALDMVYVATGAADIFWEAGCWEWDVCAGAVLVLEAGGRFAPSQPPDDFKEGDEIPEADLGSRLYLAIRPCAPTEDETVREQQDRLVREVWRRAERLDYVRPK
ncbi:inositol monophosphatase [Meredithblackwellia eburnea MCA 4105]